jgi:cellulose synthase/poly-beta-1,6-N-acetylglucosamine synthase-like glycosyltransferase
MLLREIVIAAQWFFLCYVLALNSVYLALNFVSFFFLSRYMKLRSLDHLPRSYSGFEPPISILAPAYNEAATIEASVRSLLQLDYPEFEIIVINDGSDDNTLNLLIEKFSLQLFPAAYRVLLPTEPVNAVYSSPTFPNLRVIDKKNGGKADALNAGINISRYPLFCAIDVDSILQRNSLQKIVQPFLDDPTTVACGGAIRIANGCEVKGGLLVKAGLPHNGWALFQIVEYLRSFLFGRLGWTPFNALLIISGAFGLFDKEAVISVGGYCANTVGEDMELITRLHRCLRKRRRAYRINFLPDPVCWTETPEDLKTLMGQRIRWQRGLAESLFSNIGLFFNRRGGIVGWLAFPFMIFFEFCGPIVELAGYIFVLIGFLLHIISIKALLAFLVLALGFGLLLPTLALLMEEISFQIYIKPKHIWQLFMVGLAENFGYRQLHLIWKLLGLLFWLVGRKAQWGKMSRTASWQKPIESA